MMASPISRRAASPCGLLDNPLGHGPAFALVGSEQPVASPPLDHAGKLPAEIGRISHPCVETKAAGRRVLMRGVACEEDAPRSISVRHEVPRHPTQHRYHLMRHRLSHHAGDKGRGIHACGIVEIVFSAQSQPP
jgi:hypothetical protein